MALTPEQWQQVEALFHAASPLPEGERVAHVQAQPALDDDVRRSVLRMLEADRRPGRLDLGAGAVAGELLRAAGPGAIPEVDFGPYRVEAVLGEGGMGIVYRAVRADVGARVALKVLWDAPLSPRRHARFREEQRILAALRHPGIVSLYDAGVQPDGTPWFAMELVDGGVPITAYAATHQLTVPRRVQLVLDACAAVRAAHERLVVHGDLKPSNILVAADGRVRLLDFGVATRLDPMGEGHDAGTRLLTPAYASPERRAGSPAVVETDVYALGVILHELLAGRLPRPQRNDWRPPSAETSLPRARENRRVDWDELDHVVAVAMGIRDRRFSSVEALQRDLERALGGWPLESRSGSPWYRMRKFVQRQRVAAALAGALLLASSGALVAHDRTLRQARNAALVEAARTERLKRFLEDLFQGGGVAPEAIDSLRVTTLVANGIREVAALTSDPAVQTDLLESLAVVSERLGMYERADSLIREAITRSEALHGDGDPRTLRAQLHRASILTSRNVTDSAEALLRQLEARAARLPDDAHPVVADINRSLGVFLRGVGRGREGVPYLERAVVLRARADTTSRAYGEALRELGNAQYGAGLPLRADSTWVKALPVMRRRLGPGHPDVAYLISNLGFTASTRGDLVLAEARQREALVMLEAWYGADHIFAAVARLGLAQTLVRQRKGTEALPLIEQTISTYARSREIGPTHGEMGIAVSVLASAYGSIGDHARAAREYRRAIPILEASFGPLRTSTLNTTGSLARELIALGQADSAVALTATLVQRAAEGAGARSIVAASMRMQHGLALVEASRAHDAIPILEEAVAVLDTLTGTDFAGRPGRAGLEKARRSVEGR